VTSIAIVGAGPQLGLAIARTFGSHGLDVALISRDRDKLDDLVGKLTTEGITAAAFPADVLDRDALTQALKDAATQFDGIDVLEYSPVGTLGSTTLTTPADTEPTHVQHEIEFQLYGAITATKAVLPAMRAAGTGIQAAHVAIDVSIGTPTFYGQVKVAADQISPVYWALHTTDRAKAEQIFKG
jgi:NADP-dependent 3-hydroxy acid dehydrogenase YdfG